jgi:uncharacterized membrane protein YfcA
LEFAWLALTAYFAGAINSVAGGGTLLTFPALLSLVSPAAANATSTIALLPGSLAGAWGYRKEIAACRRFVMLMLLPSIVGGFLGAVLVIQFKDAFAALVPWLILTAALLFLVQQPLSKWLKAHKPDHEPSRLGMLGLILGQFLIAIYGGYFGAGIGILMLAALGFMGLSNIHHANGVKTLLAAVINGATVSVFLFDDLVAWNYAGVMVPAAILGGYSGARVARRLPIRFVRLLVVFIGFTLAAFYFWKRYA